MQYLALMRIHDAIQGRRSIKRFTDRPVTREELEQLLAAAALAPNHRMTAPWRFHVLGPEARHAYGLALGARKARKITDPDMAAARQREVAEEHRARPAMIAIAMTANDDPEIEREDYAAVMMAVQNIALTALELGLGTHIRTGAVMDDPAARSAVGVPDEQRIVAVVDVGEPAELPPSKPRRAAAEFTVWTP